GRSADQRWYWDHAGFITDLSAAQPKSVAAMNGAIARMVAAPAPALTPPPFCAARAQPIAIPEHATTVGAGAFGRAAGDASAFRTSPEEDASVLALSAALVRELGLGKRGATDLLTVGLAA